MRQRGSSGETSLSEPARTATTVPPGGDTTGSGPPDRITPEVGYTLGFLTIISMFNYLDRSLLGLTIPLIKQDLHLSDTALGAISGIAFVVVYSLFAIPIASLADRSNRRNIVAAGFAFWSAMTALTGQVMNGWQLAIARMLMGAGESASLAPSQSMIADLVSKAKRPMALSIFTSASALDNVILMPVMAIIADMYGWRAVYHVAGLAGVVLALLFFVTVKEPQRHGSGEGETAALTLAKVSMLKALKVLSRSRAFLAMMAGAAFMGGALTGSGTWGTAFLVRVHGLSISEICGIVGPARGILGALGIVGAGIVAERLGRRDSRWRIWTPAACCLLFVPGHLMFVLSDVPAVWISGLVITALLAVAYQGPMYAAVMNIAQPRMRSVAVAIVVFSTGLLGQVCGPVVIGYLNDVLHPTLGDEAIRYSLLLVAFCTSAAAVCFIVAARLIEEEAARPRIDIDD